MTEIQQNRWDQLVRRVAGIVGGGSQVNDTLNELFPVMDIENVPGELLALQPFDLGMVSGAFGNSAGEFNHHQIFNPEGSNVLIVITTVSFFSSVSQDMRFSNFIGALPTLAGNERRRDTRSGTLASLVAQHRTDQSIVNGGLDYRIRVQSNTDKTFTDANGISILFPGTGFTVTTGTVNTASTVAFMWRERVFQESERITRG